MTSQEQVDKNYLAISELTNEIGNIVQRNIEHGYDFLTSSDIQHILKMTSNVAVKINSKQEEIFV